MSKRYFINRTVNLRPKNKLDEALQTAFEKLINYEITEQNIYVLEIIFNNVVREYKQSGGRCQTWNFFMKNNEQYKLPNIRFHVSETCVLLLEEIKGEILPF